jgi:deoxyribodipyrimidine photo-lyase
VTSDPTTSVMVFTRDLRTRDLPALAAAGAAQRVVPLFVLDPDVLALHGSPNRTAYLLDSLQDLRSALRELGADLVLRRGPWVQTVADVVAEVGASDVHLSEDVSAFARRRCAALERRLEQVDVELVRHPGVTVVPPGETSPSGGGFWKVFTPFHRRWLEHRWRPLADTPARLDLPDGIGSEDLPVLDELIDGECSPDLARGGESVALASLRSWAATNLEHYEDLHDDLPADGTAHLAAALHLGCLSPLEVATRLRDRPGGAAFVRQLCWRDFYHQVLAARPEVAHDDYRPRGDVWNDDPEELAAWTDGRTGFPIVDAGMRQLRAEGYMHNRTRMIVASFLTKDLHHDWRVGAAHFMSWLADGDVANNQLNWQWTAGTGTDTNPHRILNPTVQSRRFDPDGTYIRRYVPELGDVDAPEIHEPTEATRRRTGYPAPMVDHHEAIAEFRAALEQAQVER